MQLITDHWQLATDSDKLREECGVVAIYGHPEASKLAYLSLMLCSIAGRSRRASPSSNGEKLDLHKAMGLVSDIFTDDVLPSCPVRLPLDTRVTPRPATRRC